MEIIKRIAVIPLVIVAGILFSILGLFPKSMSIHAPYTLQTYPGILPKTGFSIYDKADSEAERKKYPAGVFGKIGLEKNGNFRNKGYDGKNKYFYTLDDCILRVKHKKNKNLSTGRVVKNDKINSMPVIRIGKYYFYVSESNVRVQFSKKQSYLIYEECKEDEYLFSLLEKQSKSRITLQELCDLLIETANGHLLWYDPDTHTAIIKTDVENGNQIVESWNTETLESTVLLEEGEYAHIYACSDKELLYYDYETRCVSYLDLSRMVSTKLVIDEECPVAMNYTHNENNELIIAIAYDDYVYKYDAKTNLRSTWWHELKGISRVLLVSDGISTCTEDQVKYIRLEYLK